jgi:hypothetical protein
VVDQSLLRQAADRGVTICFADLDGADGLWVPEERTVPVNRGLSDAKVAEVIEHELGHVMIDDQHADLDAGKDVVVGRPPSRARRPETVALAAAVGLVAVVGGVMYGLSTARGDIKLDRVAPNPSGPGLSAHETGNPKPSTTVIRATLSDGREVERTIVITATPGLPTGTVSPIVILTGGATPTKRPPARTPEATASPPVQPPTTSAPPAAPPTTDQPAPTQVPTTPAATTPVESGAAGDGGQTGDQTGVGGTGPVGTDPADATVVDASLAPPVGDTSAP